MASSRVGYINAIPGVGIISIIIAGDVSNFPETLFDFQIHKGYGCDDVFVDDSIFVLVYDTNLVVYAGSRSRGAIFRTDGREFGYHAYIVFHHGGRVCGISTVYHHVSIIHIYVIWIF